jgi:hypothetical protein
MEDNSQNMPEISEEQKKELIKILLKKALQDKNNQTHDSDEKIEFLKKLKSLYDKKNDFQVGDILIWKKQLKNRKFPDYNEPIIVFEILEDPIFDQKDGLGSPYFNERNDIRAGVYRDDTLLIFYFDSQRFEKLE